MPISSSAFARSRAVTPQARHTLSLRTLLTLILLVLGLHLFVLVEVAEAATLPKANVSSRATTRKPVKATPVKAKKSSSVSGSRYEFPLASADWKEAWNFYVPKGKQPIKPEEGLDLLLEKDFSRVEWHADQGKFPGFLRVLIPKDSTSNFSAHFYKKPRAGVVAAAFGAMKPADEMTLHYYVRFPQDFDFSVTGALPCLSGGYSSDTDASKFSVCFSWGEEGQIGVYGRFIEGTPPGAFAPSPFFFVADDQWHSLNLSITLNTYPSRRPNGTIKALYDNKEVYRRDSVQFRTRDTDKLDVVNLFVAIGGLSPIIRSPRDMYVDLAGFSVGTK